MEASPEPSQSPRPDESLAQQQARLRRERREAKIKAGGSARLNKITSLSGRPAEEEAPPTAAFLAAQQAPPSTTTHDDPDEVDISSHYYSPATGGAGGGAPSEDQLRQMMLNFEANNGRGGPSPGMQGNPFGKPGMGAQPGPQQGQGQGQGTEEDPMMRMLQQMMGGMGAGGPGGDGGGGIPPGIAAMLGAAGGQQQGQSQPDNEYGYMWRIVHAIFALALGIYIASLTSFSGSRIARTQTVDGEVGVHFFWVFATAELMLQSGRFFLEKGRAPVGGLLGGLGMMLPEPYKGYVRVAGRYSVIYTTVVADAMVVIFVLGCVAWGKGEVS
ncbi:MAG: hypothetical protein M1827_005020 [Pycnora praestabilis]|nr:MAG: hypothetical protein M1827_005020 [Pycnora praestabilis]